MQYAVNDHIIVSPFSMNTMQASLLAAIAGEIQQSGEDFMWLANLSRRVADLFPGKSPITRTQAIMRIFERGPVQVDNRVLRFEKVGGSGRMYEKTNRIVAEARVLTAEELQAGQTPRATTAAERLVASAPSAHPRAAGAVRAADDALEAEAPTAGLGDFVQALVKRVEALEQAIAPGSYTLAADLGGGRVEIGEHLVEISALIQGDGKAISDLASRISELQANVRLALDKVGEEMAKLRADLDEVRGMVNML